MCMNVYCVMCECLSVCYDVYVCTHRVKKSVSYSLELKLQVVVNHLVWVLGTEPGSSRRVTIFPAESSLQLFDELRTGNSLGTSSLSLPCLYGFKLNFIILLKIVSDCKNKDM